jgi:hypothetical protein
MQILVRNAFHRIPKALHFVNLNRTTAVFIKKLEQCK